MQMQIHGPPYFMSYYLNIRIDNSTYSVFLNVIYYSFIEKIILFEQTFKFC